MIDDLNCVSIERFFELFSYVSSFEGNDTKEKRVKKKKVQNKITLLKLKF